MLKKEKLALIRQFYPGSLTTIDTINRVIDIIEDELEMDPSLIMFADSICSDDVNSIQYPARLNEFLGPFKMGGLDGFPFTGLTGMAAFSSHVPDNGGVFLYYGPHVGISADGQLGVIRRLGQSHTTSCCGAAIGALKKLTDNEIQRGHITEIDYQMNIIEQILLKQKKQILSDPNPISKATDVIYQAIDLRINQLIAATTFHCRYIVLMGAVLINSDAGIGSFSCPKRVEVLDVQAGTRKDYLSGFLATDVYRNF